MQAIFNKPPGEMVSVPKGLTKEVLNRLLLNERSLKIVFFYKLKVFFKKVDKYKLEQCLRFAIHTHVQIC